ncbi:uncharacterized protein fid [Neodiprion pinetum]|uniref:uncharacterized protein fid n=1 Tax=Neodiprion pinetum TaxID=441929 RepID=UPI001EDF6B0F|nr:uncharacterized protein LOC124221425 [Neodiprion pinetum]XP_046487368.1 uncharacterized protein LOC124221425 [Neodiprion pinetum]XP_046487369.1 uncharacterized protein LOC124221425 [Neodiprion pinetum]XP_046487370.1 uncharacterized protein LOC124221425 [Neodiprion pinetum]XP_046487371.1 uncharacterized protein LOC124221425 [Neodiprion pinetum]XP_046487373.1 uncharacterized protein LOC124221425 [Neodiprion pinetum]XP_046487374.1 uncharacterized protein LOC124221425 [Neodiprion pinetum]XP_0
MSESDGEQTARSVALEQAYVHEVYEQCAEKTAQSRHWPRIYQFLEELEPGALVCDVGCGNGKYLSVNQSIFKVGADRCKHLTDIAREKENEVLICDNLSLPFRDDSFDAVLSIAVVHHFATTERRIHALKELARVLRIGGRLVISVWAMEQRHRKFESQDVLIPWPKAYCLSSFSNGATYSGIPYADEIQHNQIAPKDFLTSKRNSRKKYGTKSYWIDPVLSPSPSTSSLSSPNETCYSFVRRALQKLAGGKRNCPGSRPWFLETWSQSGGKVKRHMQQEYDSGDVDDLPIELRRLEDLNATLNKYPDTLSVKSKSLGDILEIQRLNLVRSRSSIPGLCSTLTSDSFLNETAETPPLTNAKPKLVKQKSHFIEDVCVEISENTAIQELIKDLPDFQTVQRFPLKRGNVQKQSSLNEELMSIDRLKEKEKVRRNIMKQASLNEEIICNRKAFEAFKDSLYSTNATKRFQLLKSGLTNRIKQSTTNIEKVSGMSIKNGFVKMLQGWTSAENEDETSCSTMMPCEPVSSKLKPAEKVTTTIKKDAEIVERRLSREDGSDSSKDSSLQSDTSVDSEDSFASVIYVPKHDLSSIIDAISATPGCQLSAMSAPPSPRVKHPPDLMGPRLKLIPISPLLKQFPATSKSLPPTSPPGLSPRTLNSIPPRKFFSAFSSSHQTSIFDKLISADETDFNSSNQQKITDSQSSELLDPPSVCTDSTIEKHSPTKQLSPTQVENEPMSQATNTENVVSLDEAPLVPVPEEVSMPRAKMITEKSSTESINEEESRKSRLNQIKELLKQKPGFATRCAKPSFPLVRRASAAAPGRLETVTRPLPRLLSLELFNPETDDLDSDSSGVSSPESVGSVISVISDERFTTVKDNVKLDGNGQEMSQNPNERRPSLVVRHSEFSHLDNNSAYELLTPRSLSESSTEVSLASSQSIRLLEAAAIVASSLEDAVETAIQVKPHSDMYSSKAQKYTTLDDSLKFPNSWRSDGASPSELQELLDDSKPNSFLPETKTWDEECRQQLIDFTEKLNENLIHDIDKYCQKTELEFSQDSKPKRIDLDVCVANLEPKVVNSFIIDSYIPRYKQLSGNEKLATCKYSELVDTNAWLNKCTNGMEISKTDNKPSDNLLGLECSNADISSKSVINNVLIERGNAEDIMDFVLVSNNGEYTVREKNEIKDSCTGQGVPEIQSQGSATRFIEEIEEKARLRFGNSIESSDIGDSIENTTSLSDFSQTESFRESVAMEKTHNGSSASLGSCNTECKSKNAKSKLQSEGRSASEEINSRPPMVRQQASVNSECILSATSNGTLTGSSSQESLPSDHGGGAITYHQYYHVFREGELDQLINKYVENLHIISSYYDHASWCIVAEKVQVWTI